MFFKGAYKSEGVKLEDIGAVAGIMWDSTAVLPVRENYLGAKCWGQFSVSGF